VDIYRISDNTQNKIEQLTFTPTIGEYHLLVSKNGDKIIFEAGATELTAPPSELALEKLDHIYILDTVSRELEDITDIFTAPPIIHPPMQIEAWSPDQKQFAFINYQTGLGIMNFDGTNRKDIPMPSLGEFPNIFLVSWSPDGKKLAMNHNVDESQQLQNPGAKLLVYDLERGTLTQLADYNEGCAQPKWSPTSQQVVATCSYRFPYFYEVADPNVIPETVRIFDVNHPGQPYERLTFSPCSDSSWSPDGKQIAFVCYKDASKKGLFIVNSDGNDIHEVNLGLGNLAVLKNPSWSPDGTQIVYVAGADSGHTNIYSVHPDGSDNHPLTTQVAFYSIVSVYPVP
jgi:Tol biopolymer transport system component